ncbi:MAG: CRISPR-associated helicase Cas3' [Verrucomicrobia bacterium]|jgi:CRISPR-associated endonuclease/helicase Cas3|nr:CRISPR-associated helicase Cas3' [Verrucomicrobiota bacterium]
MAIYYAHTANSDPLRLERGEGQGEVSKCSPLRSPPSGLETGREGWQRLAAHLRNVANLAKQFAAPLGLAAEAELAGLLHDLGKYAERFQARLRNPAIHGINHWAAGTAQAASVKAWAVAFAADGHHTGIPALHDNTAGISLGQTVKKFASPETRSELTGQCPESLEELLVRFAEDKLQLPTFSPRSIEDRFVEALRTRMLFSCLVDADFLDTEQHFNATQSGLRAVPELQPEQALVALQRDLQSKSSDGSVNALRRQLLQDCLKSAEKLPGLFTLTAPTGSGKTLSSLAFALRHIVHHNTALAADDPRRFRRIIVVIPYTSIIEQTAQVYRKLFEEAFGSDYLLEHHSAVAPRERKEDSGRDAEDERLRRARLAAENWISPLVVTTNVQFFESLFSNRPSDCRKLHNIGRSVVLFDEVQTLPPRLVPSLLSAVRLLTRDYGVTAVFMTATQPAFAAAGPALPYDWQPVEISSNPTAMAETLKRTRIELPAPNATLAWPELAQRLATETQSLCVVNTTKDARELFRLVKEIKPAAAFHLSARMCPAHRQEKLAEIRRRLDPKAGEPCRLVSTQLIEAGVDVDFPIAFRALGPLDSIIQTAGRCNREGRHPEPRPVVVFRPVEIKLPPGAYALATAKTEEFLARHPDAPLHQPETYRKYFSELYKLVGPEKADADKVFKFSTDFDFPAAAEACQLVGNETRAVLVKWKDKDGKNRGEELAEKLHREKHLTAVECRKAQRFSVNLYQSEFFDAQARGYVYQPAKDWDFWVWNSDYDDNLGLGHVDSNSFVQ